MNEKDSKAIHDLFSEFHYSDNLGLLKSKLVNYATTIRQEERRAAFKEAVAIIVGQPTAHYIYSGATPMAAETFRDNAIGAIEAAIAIEQARRSKLEAAANETREDGDDG